MRETTVIDSVSASIEWTLTADKVCFPEVWVDGYVVARDEITLEQPEDVAEYEQAYGIGLNPEQFYYCDGECLHEQMNNAGPDNSFADWLANEVNAKLAELNGA